MRLDHIAYRTGDRHKTANFFIEAFGYKVQQEFEIKFDNGTSAKCIALEPPEKVENSPWDWVASIGPNTEVEFHVPPEIFVSDGEPGSIVGDWVTARNGIGGIHHLAYLVDSVEEQMKAWREKGYAEFTTENPLTCEGLTQCFTKPSELTGVIYEFIERDEKGKGFCEGNVKDLMESTKDLS